MTREEYLKELLQKFNENPDSELLTSTQKVMLQKVKKVSADFEETAKRIEELTKELAELQKKAIEMQAFSNGLVEGLLSLAEG